MVVTFGALTVGLAFGVTTLAAMTFVTTGLRGGASVGLGPKTAGFRVACGAGATAGATAADAIGRCTGARAVGTPTLAVLATASGDAAVVTDGATAVATVTGATFEVSAAGNDEAAPTDPTGIVNTKSIRNAIAVPRRRCRSRADLRLEGVPPRGPRSGRRPNGIGDQIDRFHRDVT